MADYSDNKIVVQVQVEPTPVVAELMCTDSSASRAETAETDNQQPSTSAEAHPDARGTRPDGTTPDAPASGVVPSAQPALPDTPDARWQ